MMIRVAVCQQRLHENLGDDVLRRIMGAQPHFLCLPEHYPLPKHVKNIKQAADLFDERKQYLCEISKKTQTVLIGGTLTEPVDGGFHNTCYVFSNGVEAGFYRKVYPTEREIEAGVIPGKDFCVFDLQGVRAGVLICADVLFERSYTEMASRKCAMTFVPTASPFRSGETVEQKFERDHSIFVEGAKKLRGPMIKTCGVGSTFGHPIQGRSLIATPAGILTRAEPHQENDPLLLIADLEV